MSERKQQPYAVFKNLSDVSWVGRYKHIYIYSSQYTLSIYIFIRKSYIYINYIIFCGAQFRSACVFLMPGSPSYSQLEVGDLILIQPGVVTFLEGTTIPWRIFFVKTDV